MKYGTTVHYTYNSSNWPDQLTFYAGQTITYDNSGNPLTYIDGMSFTWERGRQLSQITMSDNSTISYAYNEIGLRTYKETSDYETTYEWDGNRIIREIITDKATNKKTDIWYLYDGEGSIMGFEYNYFPVNDILANIRCYYEKNLQGDVIGILTAHGDKVVSYTYDAWGNVTSSSCATGAEMVLALNHIKYRGYYQYDETGFYYLQSRYYDSEVGRFINADDVNVLGIVNGGVFRDNLYCYCNNNPTMFNDPSGNFTMTVDMAFLGITIFAVCYVVYLYCITSYQYRQYSQDFYRSIQYSLSQTWNWFTILFTSTYRVVEKAVERNVAKAQTVVRRQRNHDYYWIVSKVTFRRGNVIRESYFPCMPITKDKAIVYVRQGGSVFANTEDAARRLAYEVGYGRLPINDTAHGGIGYFKHYHAYNHKGGHIFYF